ncbi:MAG: ATP-binding protein, partial [Coriobacteriales bacterium]
PVAATIAAAIAAAYRLYLGGAGTIAGVGVIAEATVAGIAMYYLRKRHEEVTRSGCLYLFAVLVHVGMLLIQLSLPGGIAPGVLRQIAAPVLVMYPLGQLLVCRLILDQEERLAREQELERLTASLGLAVDDRTRQLTSALDELAQTNEELTSALENLSEASEAKSAFLRSMSHELRTPLNSIIGFSDLLRSGMSGPVNDQQRKQLEMINHSGTHLLRLVNELLDLSRIESGKVELGVEHVDVRDMVDEAIETVVPDAEAKGLTLEVDSPDVPLEADTDPLRLTQILLNLLSNAIKFTEKGSVAMRVRQAAPGVLEFSVTDTGPGVPEELRDDIFSEFVQADASPDTPRQGVGLGLPISRGLAQRLGGTLTLEQSGPDGSTFVLRLPQRTPAT